MTNEATLSLTSLSAVNLYGQFKKYNFLADLRRFILGFNIFEFDIDENRYGHPLANQEHLSPSGANLPVIADNLKQASPEKYAEIMAKMQHRIPGVVNVVAHASSRDIKLMFKDSAFDEPFSQQFVSDGSMKMLALLLLLNQPKPHALLASEEPEKDLYHETLEPLVEDFRAYASTSGQLWLSTHSIELVNAVKLEELYVITKKDGFAQITHASDDPMLSVFVEDSDVPGSLWRQGLLIGVSQ